MLAGGTPVQTHMQAFGQLVSLVMVPASVVFPVLIYFDIRLRKEELMLPPVRDIETPGGVGAAA